jgi:hypothetical protein
MTDEEKKEQERLIKLARDRLAERNKEKTVKPLKELEKEHAKKSADVGGTRVDGWWS